MSDIRPEQVIQFAVETTVDPTAADDFDTGYVKGTRWLNTATNQAFVSVDDTVGNAVWRLDSVSAEFLNSTAFDAYDAAGGQTFTGGATDFIWDTQVISDPDITLSGAEITVLKTSRYNLDFGIAVEQSTGNSRSYWVAIVQRDTGSGYAVIPGLVVTPVYSRNDEQGDGTASRSRVLDLNAGDKIKIVVQRLSGGATLSSIAGASSISLAEQRGAKGDKGDTGAGSNITIEDEGVSLGNFDTINFQGGAVTVTPDGTTADVTITSNPTPSYIKNETEATRTATSYLQRLRLSFVAEAGDYLLKWQCEVRSDDGDIPTMVRVQLNDSGTLMEVGMDSEQKTKTDFTQVSGFDVQTVTAGVQNLDLDFASGEGGKTVRIRRVRLFAKKL